MTDWKPRWSPLPLAKRKALWRAHCDEWDRIDAINQEAEAAGSPMRLPYPAEPATIADLRCGAKNRRGKPCKQHEIYANGRCRYHGGLSSGPTSDAGRERARANLALRWASKANG